ncbi:MAG: class I SAM-dependent methyltransferase [Patescibacteria group bacterium]|nr:class I SAM-dependent methyltransferase [Patescibacteria group bacterium]
MLKKQSAWEKEYQKPLLVTKKEGPQNFIVQFLKYLKKEKGLPMSDLRVLDLGCGTGRNSNYLAERGNLVFGLDLAANALKLASERAEKAGLSEQTKYLRQSIGDKLPFEDNSFDLILDITASNSIKSSEREVYLKESSRVLKPGGFMILRTLCKDGDQNAKKLLETNPGGELDTYFLKDLGITERVFSEVDLKNLYGRYFYFDKLVKDVGYPQIKGITYKRKYWLAIMIKK